MYVCVFLWVSTHAYTRTHMYEHERNPREPKITMHTNRCLTLFEGINSPLSAGLETHSLREQYRPVLESTTASLIRHLPYLCENRNVNTSDIKGHQIMPGLPNRRVYTHMIKAVRISKMLSRRHVYCGPLEPECWNAYFITG